MFTHPAIPWFINRYFAAAVANGYLAEVSPYHHRIRFAQPQHHVINPTNSCSAFNDGIEHRLHVRRRAADNAEYLGCSCLMFQRFGELTLAIFQLFGGLTEVLLKLCDRLRLSNCGRFRHATGRFCYFALSAFLVAITNTPRFGRGKN
jgi:hypothetical protein